MSPVNTREADMTRLTTGQRQALEQQLRALVTRLRQEIAEALRADGSKEALGLVNHLQDIDDAAVANLETGLEIAAVQRDVRELIEAQAALQRINSPEFGLCQGCRADIGHARLQANPAALRCLACQSSLEKASGNSPHSL